MASLKGQFFDNFVRRVYDFTWVKLFGTLMVTIMAGDTQLYRAISPSVQLKCVTV